MFETSSCQRNISSPRVLLWLKIPPREDRQDGRRMARKVFEYTFFIPLLHPPTYTLDTFCKMGSRGLHPVCPPPFLLVNWGKGCRASSDYHKHTIKMRGHPRGIPKLRDGMWGRWGRMDGAEWPIGTQTLQDSRSQKKERKEGGGGFSCWIWSLIMNDNTVVTPNISLCSIQTSSWT